MSNLVGVWVEQLVFLASDQIPHQYGEIVGPCTRGQQAAVGRKAHCLCVAAGLKYDRRLALCITYQRDAGSDNNRKTHFSCKHVLCPFQKKANATTEFPDAPTSPMSQIGGTDVV